jgi:hypothetical protein
MVTMLEKAINYVQCLELQIRVRVLSRRIIKQFVLCSKVRNLTNTNMNTNAFVYLPSFACDFQTANMPVIPIIG